MADREHTKQPREEIRPVDTDAVPDEEGVSNASAADKLDDSPGGQLNRPDQPDFDPDERRQYDDPQVISEGPYDEPISDADRAQEP